MAINYVRFQRGTKEAYLALKSANQIDNNTLYFIYPEDSDSIGELYLGNRIISGGDVTIASASLDDLSDVILSETGENSFLVQSANGNWVSKSLEDVIALIGAVSGSNKNPTQIFEVDLQEGETDFEAIARVAGDAVLASGDIAIVKVLIYGTKYQYTSYVYKENWVAMDGNYNAENVYFDEDFTFTEEVGTVTIPAEGYKVVDAAGKNVKEFFAALFAKEQNPTKTEPSVSINLTGAGAYEVGTKVTPKFTATFEDGKYTYGPEPTGVTVSEWSVVSTLGETFTAPSGTCDELTVEDTTNYSVVARATHTQGSFAKTNLGNESTVQIAAGSKQKTSSTITGYRKSFFGSLAEVDTLSSDRIRTLADSRNSSTNTLSVNIIEGAKQVIIAVPAGRKVTKVADEGAFGTDIFSEFKEEIIEVEGLNGYAVKPYNVYTYNPATALGKNTYTVTVTNG